MAFTWSERRRTAIIAGFAAAGLMLLAGIAFAVMYEVPSCMDGKKNQDESGIDCGGSCAYLCKADVDVPRIMFARAIASAGRTDVIAYVENRNRLAEAKAARYTVEVFDEAGALLGKREGTMDLPARATVPLYVPGILQGVASAPRAFVSFDADTRWQVPDEAIVPIAVSDVQLVSGAEPRVTAVLSNPSPSATYDRTAIATVFDAGGQAVAASKTVVRVIPGLSSATAIFTWKEPFLGSARVEVSVLPILP
jgi:hypothetical protein